MSQNLVSIESINIHRKHHLSNLDNTLAKTQECVAVKPLIQLPSTSHIYIPSKQNRPKQQQKPTEACLCEGAFHLQKNGQIPDGGQGPRMHGAQLIFKPRQGPAMELLRLQGGLWMDDSRVASYAVARLALYCDPQLVKGNVLVVQCGPLIVQTSKPANLRIWSTRDGMVGTTKPGWRLLLDRVQSGTHDRCISQSSICIVTSCKTMLIYPCTKICMYCCWDPTTQSNGLGPIWYLQPKLGFRMIPEKQFHDAWHVSCGVNSPNSLATILGTVNINANLSHNVFHLHEQTYHLSILITDSHFDLGL